MNIPLPPFIWQFERFGLVVTETKVSLVSWKKGSFTKLGDFVNDTQGVQEFNHYLKRHASKFKGRTINVMVSVVGEDYRFEKVAHLVGKYRSDMLKRRFQQLFRGTTYHMALQQGREAIGRRQDLMMFCGVLSNEKVQPWMREITRFKMNPAGVHLASLLVAQLYRHLVGKVEDNSMQVISICVEDNSIRHCFFVDGQMRFSRMSRYREGSSSEDIFRSVRNEIEKTVQYLTSIRIVQGNTKIGAHIVCAEDIIEEIRHYCSQISGGRVAFDVASARALCAKTGIKRPIDSYGRDSTPLVHEMLRLVFYNQLAPIEQIRYYIAKMSSIALCVAFGAWGAVNVAGDALSYLGTYGRYTSENDKLAEEISNLSSNYDQLVGGFVSPPSSIENMRASVNFLNKIDERTHNPGKLMLYASKLIQASPAMEVNGLGWYLTNEPGGNPGSYAFTGGDKVYEVLRIYGALATDLRSEIAFQQYENFVRAVAGRVDMQLIEEVKPSLVQADGELSGSVDVNTDVLSQLNAFTNNEFNVKLVWDTSVLAALSTAN